MSRIRIEGISDDVEGGQRVIETRAQIYGHRPEHAAAVADLGKAMFTAGTLPPRLVELVRLRVAFHNQCRTCMAARYTDEVDEGLACSLERPAEAADLTDAERAALAYADLHATNHYAIDDATFDGLREHFDEGEIVELGILCAFFVGFGRLTMSWDITEDLPESFQVRDGERITPWGHESLAVTPQTLAGQLAR